MRPLFGLFLLLLGLTGGQLRAQTFVDSTGALTVADLRQRTFTNSTLLSSEYPTWVVIQVPTGLKAGRYCIDFGTAENVEVYYKESKVYSGNLVLPSKRSIPGDPRTACISIDDDTRTIYVRFPPAGLRGQQLMKHTIRPYEEVVSEFNAGQNMALIITGGMLVIIACAFVMFYFLNDVAFFYFGIYVTAFYVMVNKNLLVTFLGDVWPSFFLNHIINQSLFIIAPVSFLVFSYVYFKIRDKSKAWRLSFTVSFALGVLCFLVVVFGESNLSTLLILFYNLIALIVPLITAIHCYFVKKWRPAGYFVAGISVPLLVAFMIVAHNLHLIFVDRLDLYADFSMLVLCFVLGLGVVQRHSQSKLDQRNQEKEAEFHRLKSESLEELNETKDKLLSVLSHDLRGPVGNLRAILSLLSARAMSNEEFVQVSARLRTDVETTYSMLEEVLQWVKSQREGIVTRPTNFDLNVLVSDVVSMSSAQANAKRISIVVDHNSEITAFADRDHISIVLRNLLGNAIKFSPEEGVVRLSIDSDEQYAMVMIKDRGVGIPAEDVDKIIRHEKVTGTRGTQGEKGTGLGLLLCQEFITYNNGTFLLESTEGHGTTTGFTIPRK